MIGMPCSKQQGQDLDNLPGTWSIIARIHRRLLAALHVCESLFFMTAMIVRPLVTMRICPQDYVAHRVRTQIAEDT